MHACVFVGAAELDVLLAVEFPIIVPFKEVDDDPMEPCSKVTLVEVDFLEVEEEEALATAMVVWKMAVVPLRVEVVVYDR